jgi:hypothetical protein
MLTAAVSPPALRLLPPCCACRPSCPPSVIAEPLLVEKIRDRNHAIHQIESLLRKLSDNPKSGVQFVEDSRWMGIYKETAFQVLLVALLLLRTLRVRMVMLRMRTCVLLCSTQGRCAVPACLPGAATQTLVLVQCLYGAGPLVLLQTHCLYGAGALVLLQTQVIIACVVQGLWCCCRLK